MLLWIQHSQEILEVVLISEVKNDDTIDVIFLERSKVTPRYYCLPQDKVGENILKAEVKKILKRVCQKENVDLYFDDLLDEVSNRFIYRQNQFFLNSLIHVCAKISLRKKNSK